MKHPTPWCVMQHEQMMNSAVQDFRRWMDEKYSKIIDPIVSSIPEQERKNEDIEYKMTSRVFHLEQTVRKTKMMVDDLVF